MTIALATKLNLAYRELDKAGIFRNNIPYSIDVNEMSLILYFTNVDEAYQAAEEISEFDNDHILDVVYVPYGDDSYMITVTYDNGL